MTYQAKYLGYNDEKSIRKLLTAAKKFGATAVTLRDSEGDEEFFSINYPDGVIETLDGADIDWAVCFTKARKYLGTFYIVLGNDDEDGVVADFGVNAWTEKVWDCIAE